MTLNGLYIKQEKRKSSDLPGTYACLAVVYCNRIISQMRIMCKINQIFCLTNDFCYQIKINWHYILIDYCNVQDISFGLQDRNKVRACGHVYIQFLSVHYILIYNVCVNVFEISLSCVIVMRVSVY